MTNERPTDEELRWLRALEHVETDMEPIWQRMLAGEPPEPEDLETFERVTKSMVVVEAWLGELLRRRAAPEKERDDG
jgi:hypothetical protein